MGPGGEEELLRWLQSRAPRRVFVGPSEVDGRGILAAESLKEGELVSLRMLEFIPEGSEDATHMRFLPSACNFREGDQKSRSQEELDVCYVRMLNHLCEPSCDLVALDIP